MLLKKIKLENVTSHAATEINFERGLNIFTGLNGTGKSTVLKMVGLYYFPPGVLNRKSMSDVHLKRKKLGRLTLWIQGKDNEEFKIVRGVGNSKISVIETKSGMAITDIENQYDYLNWIKEQMDIHPTTDIENLFQHAIGVDQGTFTAPFLETPGWRKAIFAPLLNVEIYNQIWKKYRDIEKVLEDKQSEFEKQIEGYRGELKSMNGLLNDQKETGEKISEISANLVKIEEKYNNVLTQYKALNVLKEELRNLEKQRSLLKNSQDNAEQTLKATTKLLHEAQEAEKIVKETKKEHDLYIRYEIKEKELVIQEAELRSLNEQIEKINTQLTKRETQQQEIQGRIKEIEELKPKIEILSKTKVQFEKIQQEIEELQKIRGQVDIKQKRQETLKIKNSQLSQKIGENEIKLKQFESIQKKAGELESTREQILQLEKTTSALESEISQLKQNREDSIDGNCPFLHEKCKNIGEGSLEDYFTEIIGQKMKEHSKILKSIRKERTSLISLEALEQERQNLLIISSTQKEWKTQLHSNEAELEVIAKEFKESNTQMENLSNLSEKKREIEPEIEEFNELQGKIRKDLPDLKSREKKNKTVIELLNKELNPLHKQREKLKGIPVELEQVREKRSGVVEAYKTYSRNFVSAEKVPELTKNHNTYQVELNSISKSLNQVSEKFSEKESKFDEPLFIALENEKIDLSDQKSSLEGENKILTKHLKKLDRQLQELKKVSLKLKEIEDTFKKSERHLDFAKLIRQWFREAVPKITQALLGSINSNASQIFRDLMDQDNMELVWTENFEAKVVTAEAERSFGQLSGGEQMLAALSIRLSILRVLTSIDFAFFDEPTTNLDEEKRQNLAKQLRKIRGFTQLFVISHDDTFQASSEYVVHFKKDESNITEVEFLQPR